MEILHKNEAPGDAGAAPGKCREPGGVTAGLPCAFHFERPRLNRLFARAVKCPVVMVCAGAGYGKTSAVQDFVRKSRTQTVWVQLSDHDRVGARFWENFTHAMARFNTPFAKAIGGLGFPDSVDKLNRYFSIAENFIELQRRLIVVDDFHFVEDSALIRFVERALRNLPVGTTVLLLSRSAPSINTAGMVSNGRVFSVNEDDLRFTEDELAGYFEGLGISLGPASIREVMRDTEGWAFALNLAARSYQKAPGYGGYLGSAIRTNIFRIMETEVWGDISEPLQRFLLRLSLICHLSTDLVSLLAGSDSALIDEMERQNAYVRRDDYVGAYLIHPLFLEFLAGKQELLPEDTKRETYVMAAQWCDKHDFRIDALSYYEQAGDYAAMVPLVFSLPTQIPEDIARYASALFDRAPPAAFDTVEFLAVLHIRSYLCQGLWGKSAELAEHYEKRLLALPDGDMKCRTLGRLYYNWSFLRSLMCTTDDRYDFDLYIEKFCECLKACGGERPVDPGRFPIYSPGAWVNRAGYARKGSVDEYVEAFGRMSALLTDFGRGSREAENELVQGELKFYRGDVRAAEFFVARALGLARKHGQFGIAHMALFYSLRLSWVQGDYDKATQAVADIKALLDEEEYTDRFLAHDIALAWYCCSLGLPEKVPLWFRKGFSPYSHASFIENFGNQAKAWFCYATGDYPPLLSYFEEIRGRESFLFGRVEMLAIEACVRYKMREKAEAFSALTEAYETASPNEIIMPFVELGKDMRTLTTAALKEPGMDRKIPKRWLETMNRKAASYAKRQSHIGCLYRDDNNMADDVVLSAREAEILGDLSQGLSRLEIADARGLSINTVKMVIGNIHSKMGTENLADLIRLAVERKMIKVSR